MKQGEILENVQTLLPVIDEGPFVAETGAESMKNKNLGRSKKGPYSLPMDREPEPISSATKGVVIRQVTHRTNGICKPDDQDKS